VVYCAEVAKIDEVDREPPVFRMLALEMERAGVKIVDNMRIVLTDVSCVFKLDVCMKFVTFSSGVIDKEPFGASRNSSAESNTIFFVSAEPATRLLITVVNVLALAKH
jgi:hypothetical protein